MLLDEKILELERTFVGEGIPHAFGGAHALAYYAPPRATVDIDLNVFVPATRAQKVLRVLARLGVATETPSLVERIERDGQARLLWDGTPVDVFFAYDELHESSMQRRRTVEFGEDLIHVLSAEDLMIYKVVFDREKDWRDIAEMIYATYERLDFDYVLTWLGRICRADSEQLSRLRVVIASRGGDLGRRG
jgi:hypothetical protein